MGTAAVIDLESFRKQRQAPRPAATSTTMPWCPVWVWVMLVPVR